MSRTIVLADIHAYPDLIFNALEAAEQNGDNTDSIILAGDYIDIGPDPIAVLDFVENDPRVKSVLWGNHDAAILAEQRISPQSPESWALRGRLLKHIGDWDIATIVDGVIITHAGVSNNYQHAFDTRTPQTFVDDLNELWKNDIHIALNPPDEGMYGSRFDKYYLSGTMFNDEFEPLWYRPSSQTLLKGIKQIAGHTPVDYYTEQQVKALRTAGLRLIDPYSRKVGTQLGRYKYAVIDDGHVRVREGVL